MAERTFHIAVLGKTLEHLGSQLYKRRDAAIAELVANAWDAGATEVFVTVPENGYDPTSSEISVIDTGIGMTPDDVEDHYLVVGRNRRLDEEPPAGRRVMGRKGIGKLAGFGIATEVELTTWRAGKATRVVLPLEALKQAPGDLGTVDLEGEQDIDPPADAPGDDGTRVLLRGLRHATPIEAATLKASLARRFSRTVRGEMTIRVNGEAVAEPSIDFELRYPEDGWAEQNVGGETVRYYYGFSRTVLTPSENRGFVVYVHGKTAQAPPFFFGVEGTASGQHGTAYLHGAIEAGFLDDDAEEETDIISTDRQEIDWSHERASDLSEWGADLTRRALIELRNLREDKTEDWVLEDPDLKERITRLDRHSREKVTTFVRALGRSDNADRERVLQLSGSLVAAFEYQHFHDLLGDIEEAADDPDRLADLLDRILSWKVLESRAILEVIRGRLEIVDKFHAMVIEDAPERAPEIGIENLHDLLTSFPWLIHPEWQVFEHERELGAQLREWLAEDVPEEDRDRVDFLALTDGTRLVVVEIKRPGHTATLEEYQRLQTYMDKLRKAWQEKQGDGEIMGLLVCTEVAFDEEMIGSATRVERWADLYQRVRHLYGHYRGVLEQDVGAREFDDRQREVSATRSIVERGAYLDKSNGKPDLGPS